MCWNCPAWSGPVSFLDAKWVQSLLRSCGGKGIWQKPVSGIPVSINDHNLNASIIRLARNKVIPGCPSPTSGQPNQADRRCSMYAIRPEHVSFVHHPCPISFVLYHPHLFTNAAIQVSRLPTGVWRPTWVCQSQMTVHPYQGGYSATH